MWQHIRPQTLREGTEGGIEEQLIAILARIIINEKSDSFYLWTRIFTAAHSA